MYHLSLFDTLIRRIKIICLVHFTVWHVNTSTTDDIHILSILSKIYDYVGKGKHFFFIFEISHVYHRKQQIRGIHLQHNISTYTAKKKQDATEQSMYGVLHLKVTVRLSTRSKLFSSQSKFN